LRPITLYFHGLPGSAGELACFGPGIAEHTRHFHVIARGDALTGGAAEGYFVRLAAQILAQFPEGPLRLVGFSLGAAAALRVAPHLAERVQQIDLVSPAAPLGLGDFLDGMAGAPVFRAALAGRAHFTLLTFLQAQVARLAPAQMASALMARAQGADRSLAADPHFIAQLAASLRHSLLAQRAAYRQEIALYVTGWSDELAKVHQPVAIWQGSEDDWTPPAMAQALAQRLPSRPAVEVMPGLPHFSALRAYLAAASPA
jgi:pimeloyl-ACP methyl ester carboxylesterase